MKGPYLYCAVSLAILTKNNILPAWAVLFLLVVFIISGIMSVCQLIGWITKKLNSPMTVEQRNQAARDYEAQKDQTKSPASSGRVGPPPLP
jgi:hypothetical protein